MSENRAAAAAPDDIDLGLVVGRLLKRWKFIAISAVIFAGLGLIYLNVATHRYAAELKVIPVYGENSFGGALGGLSSLAMLVGVRLPSGEGNSSIQLYMEGIHSQEAAERLARDSSIMTTIFHDEWDEAAQNWRDPNPFISSVKEAAAALVGRPATPWMPPDATRLRRYIEENVDVEQDTRTPVVTLSMVHEQPEFATRFLALLDREVDRELKARALARGMANVKYLIEKAESVSAVEHRQALTAALIEQEKQLMMASSDAPFAAEPFGSPVSSADPVTPNPLLTISLAVVLGFLASSAWILARSSAGD